MVAQQAPLRRAGTVWVPAGAGPTACYPGRADPIDVVVFFVLVLARASGDPAIWLPTSSSCPPWSPPRLILLKEEEPSSSRGLARLVHKVKEEFWSAPPWRTDVIVIRDQEIGSRTSIADAPPKGEGEAALTAARPTVPKSQEEEEEKKKKVMEAAPPPPQGQEGAKAVADDRMTEEETEAEFQRHLAIATRLLFQTIQPAPLGLVQAWLVQQWRVIVKIEDDEDDDRGEDRDGEHVRGGEGEHDRCEYDDGDDDGVVGGKNWWAYNR